MIFTALVSVYITANNRLTAEGFEQAIQMLDGASKAYTDTIQDLQVLSAVSKNFSFTESQTFGLQYLPGTGNRYRIWMKYMGLGIDLVGAGGTTYIIANNITIPNENEAKLLLAQFNHTTIVPGADSIHTIVQYIGACISTIGLIMGNIVRIGTEYVGAWMYLMGF